MSTTGMLVDLLDAVDAMADAMAGIDLPDEDGHVTTWTGMTCAEVDSIAEVLRIAGRDLEADTIIKFHAVTDDEGDAHFGWEAA